MTSTMRFDKWENSLGQPYGAVLQVVNSTYSTEVLMTGTSYVSSGLTATITPKFASSKILVIAHTAVQVPNRNIFGMWTIFRGTVAGVNLGNGNAGMCHIYPSYGDASMQNVSLSILDSPSTTSAQTYTLAMRTSGTGNTIESQNNGSLASMTLLEIAQ